MTDDFTTPNMKERYKPETGIESKTEFSYFFNKNRYYGSLELFGNFRDLSKWTVRWTNELQVSIWKAFALILKFDVYYDEKQMKRTQYKQSIRLGAVMEM